MTIKPSGRPVPVLAAAGRDSSAATMAVTRPDRTEILLAVAAFAVLSVAVLSVAPHLQEPDDYAYRASIVALTQGHPLTLSGPAAYALFRHLDGGNGPAVIQWVQAPGGRWISEKNPGYPFLAVPFQLLGIIRLAPLCYGALGCLGLFAGARRWLGRFGGAAAVGLFCSSGAAMLFAWRDYMPTFTDASLIAAGTGALLWAVLATEASDRKRTWAGLAGFVALEAAVFVRYTDVMVLGCAAAAVAVTAAGRGRAARLPGRTLGWWLGSVLVFGACVAWYDKLVYGSPLTSGYPGSQITFSRDAILPNLRLMPAHLIGAMPMLLLGLAALAWITARRVRLRRSGGDLDGGGELDAVTRRDFAVAVALAATWFGVWALYAAYAGTTVPFAHSVQVVRYYVPALGAISLLGAWLLVRAPNRPSLAAVTSAATVVAMFGLGFWSFGTMHEFVLPWLQAAFH